MLKSVLRISLIASLAVATLWLSACASMPSVIPGVIYDTFNQRRLPRPCDPYEPIVWRGCEFHLYDVDDDGSPDWARDVKRNRLHSIIVYTSPFKKTIGDVFDDLIGSGEVDKFFKSITSHEPDVPRSPLGLTTREAYELYVHDDDGAVATVDLVVSYDLPGDDPFDDDAWVDLWVPLPAGGDVPDPLDYVGLQYEIGQILPKDHRDPAFNWVRVVGTPDTVFDYALDLGLDVTDVIAALERRARFD